ncbi:MAG: transglycosylase domain-containing protein [Rhizomicrobium sp.]
MTHQALATPHIHASGGYSFAQRLRLAWILVRLLFLAAVVAAAAVAGSWALREMRTSSAEADFFSREAARLTYALGAGPSDSVRFPRGGPYDARLGYSGLPQILQRLRARHFEITRQARQSPALRQEEAAQGYAIYREKQHAGLHLSDRSGATIYASDYPERSYSDFRSVPPIVVRTLLFIEDRYLLETRYPRRNPAIEWKRFLQAGTGWIGGLVNRRLRSGGASTLATQIEKFRHSPEGRTTGVLEKLRQMEAATIRAYLRGPDTLPARRQIVTDYLDSTQLGSRRGYGEVIGVADGLRVWYGTDFDTANKLLADPAPDNLLRKAEVYKQVLSLLLAERRPAYYLMNHQRALAAFTDRNLRRLAANGVIGRALAEAALRAPLVYRLRAPAPAVFSFVDHKGADAIRTELLRDTGIPSLYDLEHVDVSASTTLDAAAQHRVADFLMRLRDPDQVKALGLVGKQLLGGGNPARVNYSIVLYEHGHGHNFVRVHADSLNEPFDLNSGTKLQLGSTAKLRTLVTYLEIVSRLHARYAALPAHSLKTLEGAARDPLSQWALGYLATTGDRSLKAMLDAAMQRKYSASPDETFLTGGGEHVFHNFAKWEDYERPTVEAAFANSINLAFVRIMRDVVRWYVAEYHLQRGALGPHPDMAARHRFLERFADQEGRAFLQKFYDAFRGRDSRGRLALVAGKAGPYAKRLTVVFRSLRPNAGIAALAAFLRRQMHGHVILYEPLDKMYAEYGVDRFSLTDRGYLSHVHPLELWLAGYLDKHPNASRDEVFQASVKLRQDVYRWLFKTHNPRRQDWRIRVLVEQDAFRKLGADWRKLGYPFAHLVPSLATAIGSSGDRPDALAELMGIIVNNGVRQPTIDIRSLKFAAGTPYETDLRGGTEKPVRLLSPQLASTVRHALGDVVTEGTGKGFQSAYTDADGKPLLLGGKTGTGDNRYDTFGPGRSLISSRVVDRTATFVFYLGDRFFGTITAYVPGRAAAQFHFTSALAVQLLKTLAPEIQPLFAKRPDLQS